MSARNLAIQAGRDGAAVEAAGEALDREKVVAGAWGKEPTLSLKHI